LPKLLGKSNAGREFYFKFIPTMENLAVWWEHHILIISETKTKVTLEVPSQGYVLTKYTIPNFVIEFAIPPSKGQCYRKNDHERPEIEQIYDEDGIHISSDNPIICYGVTLNSSSGTTESFVILPIEHLGTEYIVSSYADPSSNINQWLPSYTAITVAYDKTELWFTLGGNEHSRTAAGLLTGQTQNWKNLNKGDVLLIGSQGQYADLSGSKISSTKPVSVVSGSFCSYVPVDCAYCNLLQEMEIPTYAWGKTYHVTPIFGRKKNSIIKIYAKEPMTNVYRDGEFLSTISTAGGIEDVGYLHLRADEGEPKPIVISADKPINVTQYNTGTLDDSTDSEPYQMVLLPVELYQKEITFITPGVEGMWEFSENFINLCFESDLSAIIPEDIEIAFYDTKDSVFEWYKLKDTLSKTSVAFSIDNEGRQYSVTTFRLPFIGICKLRANRKLQAYMYGSLWGIHFGMPASVYLDSVIYNDVPIKPIKNIFKIFPNPATDELIIRTHIGFVYESKIAIYDLIGKELYEEVSQLTFGTDKTIDIRAFSSGVYYIQISIGKEVFTQKFFVIR